MYLEIDRTENYCFEKVERLKHMGVDTKSRNNNHEEIKPRINVGDGGYFALRQTFRFKEPSKKCDYSRF